MNRYEKYMAEKRLRDAAAAPAKPVNYTIGYACGPNDPVPSAFFRGEEVVNGPVGRYIVYRPVLYDGTELLEQNPVRVTVSSSPYEGLEYAPPVGFDDEEDIPF